MTSVSLVGAKPYVFRNDVFNSRSLSLFLLVIWYVATVLNGVHISFFRSIHSLTLTGECLKFRVR
jgi:hypothetical protein